MKIPLPILSLYNFTHGEEKGFKSDTEFFKKGST